MNEFASIGIEQRRPNREAHPVLTKEAFLMDFVREAGKAQQEVLTMVMNVTPGEVADTVVTAFSGVPKGVVKRLYFDGISRLSAGSIFEPYSWIPPIRGD